MTEYQKLSIFLIALCAIVGAVLGLIISLIQRVNRHNTQIDALNHLITIDGVAVCNIDITTPQREADLSRLVIKRGSVDIGH